MTPTSPANLVRHFEDTRPHRGRALHRLDPAVPLRRVGGRLEIGGHCQRDTVVLDRLEHAGGLALEDNPAWPAEEWTG